MHFLYSILEASDNTLCTSCWLVMGSTGYGRGTCLYSYKQESLQKVKIPEEAYDIKMFDITQ